MTLDLDGLNEIAHKTGWNLIHTAVMRMDIHQRNDFLIYLSARMDMREVRRPGCADDVRDAALSALQLILGEEVPYAVSDEF